MSSRAPFLPTLWGDFIAPKDTLKIHKRHIINQSVYTPKVIATTIGTLGTLSLVDIDGDRVP